MQQPTYAVQQLPMMASPWTVQPCGPLVCFCATPTEHAFRQQMLAVEAQVRQMQQQFQAQLQHIATVAAATTSRQGAVPQLPAVVSPPHASHTQKKARPTSSTKRSDRKRSRRNLTQSFPLQPSNSNSSNNSNSNSNSNKSIDESITEKAFHFVEELLQVVQTVQAGFPHSIASHTAAVAKDDLFCLTRRLLQTQHEFALAGKPCNVNVGFHFTRHQNMAKIRENGLLARRDCTAQNNLPFQLHGASLGDGVYTADDAHQVGPELNYRYGQTGLLVARFSKDRTREPRKAPSAPILIPQRIRSMGLVWFACCMLQRSV